MKYPDEVVARMWRHYLAKVIAAALCAPPEDNDNKNGIFIEL